MSWLYHQSYFGPDRRGERFQVRFVERRGKADVEAARLSLAERLKQFAAKGLRWVDHFNYFGPDRRGDAFSYYFLERRRDDYAGTPPPLHAALRQLRVRVLEAHDADERAVLRERVMATALLAAAQERTDIIDLLIQLAADMDTPQSEADLAATVQAQLLRAAAMLGDPAP